MAKIQVLDKSISELIAAGEVIERPVSVIKEIVENAIDAGAGRIVVEIKNGGTTYMRVTDDGCGMAAEDVPVAFLRHATSKIKQRQDLDAIHTLGFRGEAMASVAAVAKVMLMTKRREDAYGTVYEIHGSEPQGSPEQSGCPDGTTVIIRDLFYNVPVRRRFMKKDVTEANAISQMMQKIALSHPEIAFQMIRDNRMEFCTDGGGSLYAAIYAIYGKEFAHDMVAVSYDDGLFHVEGYACKPLYAKSNRSFQNFFVNGRFVRSRICSVAVEGAYQSLIMTGKFPSCVLMIQMPASDMDVNVHPAKAEIRFTNEKAVSDAIFFAVKNGLMENGLIYEFQMKPQPARDWTAPLPEQEAEKYVQPLLPTEEPLPEKEKNASGNETAFRQMLTEQTASGASSRAADSFTIASTQLPQSMNDAVHQPSADAVQIDDKQLAESLTQHHEPAASEPKAAVSQEEMPPEAAIMPPVPESPAEQLMTAAETSVPDEPEESPQPKPQETIRVIGEVFKNYILAEAGQQLLIFDKHAAHERVLFERLLNGQAKQYRQLLMTPTCTLLAMDECGALQTHEDVLENMGFTFDFSKAPYVGITGLPSFAMELDPDELVTEMAQNFLLGRKNPQTQYLEDTLHTIACKAAIKANDKNDLSELQKLAELVYYDERIRHCPHGRPVMFVLKRHELEKQFKRV